jgi:hypothetical protein
MTISTKLRAEYVELANQYLDPLPIGSVDQARMVATALRAISQPQHPSKPRLDSGLQGRVESIKELLDSPEAYAKAEHVAAFRSIVRDRVASKIANLEALSQAECERIYSEQQRAREQAVANHAKMASRAPPAPGSEAHVVSEEKALSIHFGGARARRADADQNSLERLVLIATLRYGPATF